MGQHGVQGGAHQPDVGHDPHGLARPGVREGRLEVTALDEGPLLGAEAIRVVALGQLAGGDSQVAVDDPVEDEALEERLGRGAALSDPLISAA